MHFLQVDGLLNWFPKLIVYTSSGDLGKMYILMLWVWSGAWDSAFLVSAQVLLLPWACPSNSKAIKDFNPLESESCVCVVTLSCLTLYDPKDCNPTRLLSPWDFLARILEWVAIPFSRGSSQSRDRTMVSCTAGGFFTIWATREAPLILLGLCICSI